MTAPDGIDAHVPSIARVYDALLGGKGSYEADRELAARLCDPARGGYEGLPRLVRGNRDWAARVTGWAAGQGIRQFIDLGGGLPTVPSVHGAARDADPSARVAFVDRDPLVISHARAMLAGPGTAVTDADLTEPGKVLADPGLLEVIGLGEPVLLVIAAVLHFTGSGEARALVAGYAERLASGSMVAVSSVRYADLGLAARIAGMYSPGHLRNHALEDIAGWLGGLEVVPPGIVPAEGWRGDWGDCPRTPDPRAYVLCGVGRKA